MNHREHHPRSAGPSDRGWGPNPPLLILISLSGGEKHGYAIMQDVATFAGVELGPGTLYGALTRLEAAGLIASATSEERRRPYRITALGSRTLHEHLERFRSLLGVAAARGTA